jgi:hypothetical protein
MAFNPLSNGDEIMFRKFKHGMLLSLLFLLLTGCVTQVVTQPTVQPVPPTPGRPTSATLPTVVPPGATTVPPSATVAPGATTVPPTSGPTIRPTIAFQPSRGPVGTRVQISGWGFAPNEMVVVRLGLPNPVGDVLGSARSSAKGEWLIEIVIPNTLPSGERITSPNMWLVAMNERNVALASALFAFEPGNPPVGSGPIYGYASTPEEVAKYLMDSLVNYGDSHVALGYVSNDLVRGYTTGRVSDYLGFPPFTSYTSEGQVGVDRMGRPIVAVVLNTGARKLLITNRIDGVSDIWWVEEVITDIAPPTAVPATPLPGNHSPELIAAANNLVVDYFNAIAQDRPAEAWAMQTSAYQAIVNEESLATSGSHMESWQAIEGRVIASTDDSLTLRILTNIVLSPQAPASAGGGTRVFDVTLLWEPGRGWFIHNLLPQ